MQVRLYSTSRDSITEEEFIDNWLKRTYSDAETRKKSIEYQKVTVLGNFYFKIKYLSYTMFFFLISDKNARLFQGIASTFFNQIDLRGNGFTNYDEFKEGLHITQPEIVRVCMS